MPHLERGYFIEESSPGEVILSKRNELGLLSNFAATPFIYKGKKYASVEGFWEITKYPENSDDPRAKFKGVTWNYTREQVSQMTAFEAKKAGDLGEENMKKMGIDWARQWCEHWSRGGADVISPAATSSRDDRDLLAHHGAAP